MHGMGKRNPRCDVCTLDVVQIVGLVDFGVGLELGGLADHGGGVQARDGDVEAHLPHMTWTQALAQSHSHRRGWDAVGCVMAYRAGAELVPAREVGHHVG